MKPTSIRFDVELYQKIKQLAEEEKRSITKQIIIMLEAYINSTKKE